MDERYEKCVGLIACVDTKGRPRKVSMHQEYIIVRERAGRQEVEGFKRLLNEDGNPVNFIDENTFLDVFSDETLKRVRDEPV